MEILILGGILVALMVFVSTRIKKNSAKAFERERIETENYAIYKPEGFIVPVRLKSEYALEMYSKDKGEEKAGKINQAWATLKVFKKENFAEICRRAQLSSAKIISKETARDGDLNYFFMHGEGIEETVGKEIYYKIIEDTKSGAVYELQSSILNDYLETYSSKISAIMQSFTVRTGHLVKAEVNQLIGTGL